MEEEPPNLNNNPHLRGANARFLSGGENPRLYWEQASEASRVNPSMASPDAIPAVERMQDHATAMPRRYLQSVTEYNPRGPDIIAQDINNARTAQRVSMAVHPTVDLTGPPPVHTVTLDANRLPVVDLTHGVWYS